MHMNSRIVAILFISCALSFGLAAWAFMAGFGLLAAFLIYSLGGSSMVMGFAALSFFTFPDFDAGVDGQLSV
jgi:hypothetical protein